MKTAEIREFATGELQERIDAEKQNLASARMNHAVTAVEDNTTLRKSRRNIARMITILNQKTSAK